MGFSEVADGGIVEVEALLSDVAEDKTGQDVKSSGKRTATTVHPLVVNKPYQTRVAKAIEQLSRVSLVNSVALRQKLLFDSCCHRRSQ